MDKNDSCYLTSKTIIFKYLLLFILIFSCNHSTNQYPYLFIEEVKQLANIEEQSWYYTFVKSYERDSLANSINPFGGRLGLEIPKDFNVVDGVNYIENNFQEDTKLVIINESHHYPAHRAFIRSLIPFLKKKGFRHIGFEGIFTDGAAQIIKNKHVMLPNGFYLKEPTFANLLRKIIAVGQIPFEYDTSGYGGKQREIAGARNIYDFWKKIGLDEKLVIFCGYDHASKLNNFGNWEQAMARRLWELSSIEPFSINLTEFVEIDSFDKPSVFLDSSMKPIYARTNGYDLFIGFPKTKNIKGKPSYILNDDNDLVPLVLDTSITKALVGVYLTDAIDEVPYDISEYDKWQENYILVPKKREHTIRIIK